MPRMLSDEQKQHHVCKELKEQLRTESDFLYKVVTGDESWIYKNQVKGRRFDTIQEIEDGVEHINKTRLPEYMPTATETLGSVFAHPSGLF